MAKPAKLSFSKKVTDLLSKFRRVPAASKVKDLFLWELVFNSTRALFTIRRESLYDENMLTTQPELFINIVPDKTNNTLSIIDTGIGMTMDGLLNNLCTVSAFLHKQHIETITKCLKLDATSGGADVDLSWIYADIMSHRLSFFAAYMVADKVKITTKHNGHEPVVWESNGGDSFTIAHDTSGDTLLRGTKVTLFLKEDQLGYLEEHRLKSLVEMYPTMRIRPYTIYISVDNDPATMKPILDDDRKDEVTFDILQQQFEGLRKTVKEILGNKVKDVVLSDRIVELSCYFSADMETLEINPRHQDIKRLRKLASANFNDDAVKELVSLQFTAALGMIYLYRKKYEATTDSEEEDSEEDDSEEEEDSEEDDSEEEEVEDGKTSKIPFNKKVTDLLSKFRSVPAASKVKDVFLWEFIFNSSRDIYKIRYQSLSDKNKIATQPKLFINIVPDKTNNTLSIIDTGSGMTMDGLLDRLFRFPEFLPEEHLRTIDKCLKLDATCGGADVDLSWIYEDFSSHRLSAFAAFMVADKVSITSKHNDGEQVVWESEGGDSFTIGPDTSGDTLVRGTKVTLSLKEDQLGYLEKHTLKGLVEMYPMLPHIYLSVDNDLVTPKPLLDEDKKDEVPFDIVQQQFEGVRKTFVEVLANEVKEVVLSDRLFELSSFLSADMTRLEINPRHKHIKRIRKLASADPNDDNVKELVSSQYALALGHIFMFGRPK